MRHLFYLLALGSMAACGGPSAVEACEDYTRAADSCLNEALASDTGDFDTTSPAICSSYEGIGGSAEKDLVDLFSCYVDTLEQGDCSTTEGYTAALLEATTCGAL